MENTLNQILTEADKKALRFKRFGESSADNLSNNKVKQIKLKLVNQ